MIHTCFATTKPKTDFPANLRERAAGKGGSLINSSYRDVRGLLGLGILLVFALESRPRLIRVNNL